MEGQLKPPYVPSKEKLLSDQEIKKLEKNNKLIIEEIMVKKLNLNFN